MTSTTFLRVMGEQVEYVNAAHVRYVWSDAEGNRQCKMDDETSYEMAGRDRAIELLDYTIVPCVGYKLHTLFFGDDEHPEDWKYVDDIIAFSVPTGGDMQGGGEAIPVTVIAGVFDMASRSGVWWVETPDGQYVIGAVPYETGGRTHSKESWPDALARLIAGKKAELVADRERAEKWAVERSRIEAVKEGAKQ